MGHGGVDYGDSLRAPQVAGSINANPLYYTIFGLPHSEWADGHKSYEKVKMRGKMFFRPVHEVQDLRITLVWGAMCPATDGGGQLLGDILKTMAPFYL